MTNSQAPTQSHHPCHSAREHEASAMRGLLAQHNLDLMPTIFAAGLTPPCSKWLRAIRRQAHARWQSQRK